MLSRRRTVAIHVYRDGRVAVRAPLRTTQAAIAALVQERAAWITRQQERLAALAPQPAPVSAYREGESYRFLGRTYRLRVAAAASESVVLGADELLVCARDADPARVQLLVERWFRAAAVRVFGERLLVCWPCVAFLDVPLPTLSVRRMRARWGSCGHTGRIILNQQLIEMPLELIDYVLLHELCHLREHNHSPRFYALLDRALPDWRERRARLNSGQLP